MTTLKAVHPYHSVRRARVYHDRADCPIGREIHSEELAGGTGGLHLCEKCRALDKAESRTQ